MIAGIDPDSKGCIACLDGMEVKYLINADKDIALVWRSLRAIIEDIDYALIEAQNPRPLSTGVWPKGFSKNLILFGQWQGLLIANEIPFRIIHPKTWQTIIPKTCAEMKKNIQIFAQRLFPNIDLSRKKDQGKCDALCIAYYGMDKRQKNEQTGTLNLYRAKNGFNQI